MEGKAKPVEWPEEHLDDELEIEDDCKVEPDEELDDWQDEVKVDLEFKPDEELQEWKGDVKEDPFWNEHNNLAHNTSEPV